MRRQGVRRSVAIRCPEAVRKFAVDEQRQRGYPPMVVFAPEELTTKAYAFAGTFHLRTIQPVFAGATLRTTKKQIVARYSETSCVVAFDFGALVFVNVGAEERARVIAAITNRLDSPEPHAPLEEDFVVAIDPAAPANGDVGFDRVTIRALGDGELDVVCLLLAQSVSIDYYEEDLRIILSAIDKRVAVMRKTGKSSGATRELGRLVGSVIDTRNQIMAAMDVLDKPLVVWDEEALDRLYQSLHETLEIAERFKALDYKLTKIQDTLELLLDLRQTSRMIVLESTIVLLIVFEVVFAFLDRC